MKVIDLYVMVSKGEQPKKFKYRDEWWVYSVDDYDFRTLKQEYRDADIPTYEYLMSIIDTSNLNDEIEIIEEEKDIEEFNYFNNNKFINTPNGMTKTDRNHLDSNFEEIRLQINNIKRELNMIKKEGK